MIKFHEHYLKWITILLKKQESCVINGGTKTRYFPLEKSTWNGGFITSRLFILLYTAYSDDAATFLINEKNCNRDF